ncbi:YbjQ family protein [archaeon]|nr:YbjQ family protein [archaeon]
MSILLVNTPTIEGKPISEVLGLVRGSTIRARHLGKDIIAGLRNVVGGEIKEYSEMLEEAREQALGRMKKEAEDLGADAVVNIRLTTSQIAAGSAEIVAYGTAVKLKK